MHLTLRQAQTPFSVALSSHRVGSSLEVSFGPAAAAGVILLLQMFMANFVMAVWTVRAFAFASSRCFFGTEQLYVCFLAQIDVTQAWPQLGTRDARVVRAGAHDAGDVLPSRRRDEPQGGVRSVPGARGRQSMRVAGSGVQHL